MTRFDSREIHALYLISGNTKKFLYTGPKKDEQNDEQWIFTPRKETTQAGIVYKCIHTPPIVNRMETESLSLSSSILSGTNFSLW